MWEGRQCPILQSRESDEKSAINGNIPHPLWIPPGNQQSLFIMLSNYYSVNRLCCVLYALRKANALCAGVMIHDEGPNASQFSPT